MGDGSTIVFGDVKLETMETPGHTPEGITVLAYDQSADPENPYAIFTGDTLFLGDVGRPDLLASVGVTADELAALLYNSLHRKLLKLPGKTLVYPAHGAGLMCGKALSDEAVSTLEEQRRSNYALQPMTQEAFIKMVSADQPEAPAYFAHDVMMNREDRPSLDEAIKQSMKPLDLETVRSLQKSGRLVLDVRPATEYAGAHLSNALNIGIDGRFATWVGTLLNQDQSIVVIAEIDQVEEAIMRLGRIGFHAVKGYLKDGMNGITTSHRLE